MKGSLMKFVNINEARKSLHVLKNFDFDSLLLGDGESLLSEGKKIFEASLNMKKEEINSKTLTQALLKYPLITWKVKSAIYYQAFKLWYSKCPFYSHPKTN